jgi:MazG family protein
VSEPAAALEALLVLMQRLRDPQSGCPWDRQQTHASLAPFTIEEAFEVVDAIGRDDVERLRDELGDLLFQIVFHARLAEEQGRFDFAAVARGIADKLVRRHPHVFQDPKSVAIAELHVSWEAQKARERASAGARSALADVPLALPALVRAAKLGRRARRVGFDWDSAAGVRSKVAEELAEIDQALASGRADAVAEEIGDLLFTIANWARHLEFDAEDALRAAALRFERRFEHMERTAGQRGLALEGLSGAQWEELWSAAKAELARR